MSKDSTCGGTITTKPWNGATLTCCDKCGSNGNEGATCDAPVVTVTHPTPTPTDRTKS